MRLAIPAHERPARDVLIAGSDCAKIRPSRVERVSRFSPRPAVSSRAALESNARVTSRARTLGIDFLPILLFIPSSAALRPSHGERRERKGLKTSRRRPLAFW